MKPYPMTIRRWIYNFSTCLFLLGLIVLPFDSLWIICQIIKFGYLYPTEIWPTLISSLSRNLLVFIICLWETREISGQLDKKQFTKLFWFVPLFIFWFTLAPNPSWTDWTYAWRYGYGTLRVTTAFIISHIIMKTIQAIIYFKIWKNMRNAYNLINTKKGV